MPHLLDVDQPQSSFGLVDVHSHHLPDEYRQLLLELAPADRGLHRASAYITEVVPTKLPPSCGRNLFGELCARTSDLELARIGAQVISAGSLLAFPDAQAGTRKALVRSWNDAEHSASQNSDGRFSVFASLTLPDVDGAIEEAERVASRSSTVGFNLTTHVGGVTIEDERWWPLYERLNEMDATVFLHPDGFCVPGLFDRDINIDLGTQFEDTLTVVRMYRSGLLDRFPKIQWIVPHLGGVLSAVLERLDEHWERDRAHRSHSQAPSRSIGNLLFDTAGHGPKAIAAAVNVLGPECLVFGTDFPMVHSEGLEPAVAQVELGLSSKVGAFELLQKNSRALLHQ